MNDVSIHLAIAIVYCLFSLAFCVGTALDVRQMRFEVKALKKTFDEILENVKVEEDE